MTVKIVHCRKAPYDVLADRTTPWGNPFPIGLDGDRRLVIGKHMAWLLAWIVGKEERIISGFSNRWVCEHLEELRGKVVSCWCDPEPCHVGNLKALLEWKDKGLWT